MEITFYNKKGNPVIYLAPDNGNSFYTWNGHAVAYLFEDKIYGWRGKHIGWLVDGIIYDLQGFKVGSIASKCPYSIYADYAKYAKFAQFARYARFAAHARPSFRSSYANMGLVDFITQNKI